MPPRVGIYDDEDDEMIVRIVALVCSSIVFSYQEASTGIVIRGAKDFEKYLKGMVE